MHWWSSSETHKIFLHANKSWFKFILLLYKRYKASDMQIKKIIWIYQDTMISSSVHDKHLHCKWWVLIWISARRAVSWYSFLHFCSDIIHWFCFCCCCFGHNVLRINFQTLYRWRKKEGQGLIGSNLVCFKPV